MRGISQSLPLWALYERHFIIVISMSIIWEALHNRYLYECYMRGTSQLLSLWVLYERHFTIVISMSVIWEHFTIVISMSIISEALHNRYLCEYYMRDTSLLLSLWVLYERQFTIVISVNIIWEALYNLVSCIWDKLLECHSSLRIRNIHYDSYFGHVTL